MKNIFDIVHKNEQIVSLALALCEMFLKDKGAWRLHGGRFGGNIQAFVPANLVNKYVLVLEPVYGKGDYLQLFNV